MRKVNSTLLLGGKHALINTLSNNIETELENALLEPKFITSNLTVNYEAKHVTNVYNSLNNDYTRRIRDLKPCEAVNPYLTGKEVDEAYEYINKCLVMMKKQQSEKT